MNVVLHWKQQLNKNNKGSSLINVLLVVSIVSAVATLILAVTLLNAYMRKADLQGQSAFYDAESALEEIRMGLSYDASEAASVAYIDTLGKYTDLDDDEKVENFQRLFAKEIKQTLVGSESNSYYDVSILDSYLRETKYDEAKNVGAKIQTTHGQNYVNVEADRGVVLKNVIVSYIDDAGYTTRIKTDICLGYPGIDFQNVSAMENILCYSLIADDKFVAKSGATSVITGNAFLGTDGVDIENTSISFKNNNTQDGSVITGGDLELKNGATLETDDMQLWANSFKLSKSSYATKNGSTYLKNDLVMQTNSKVDMDGRFILFGNPWVAQTAESLDPEDVRKNMPNYSSAILINGAGTTLDLSKVSNLVIGGSAYVNGKAENGDDTPIVTGQSVAIKSDQRAYLVPTVCVKTCEDEKGNILGGQNPMSGANFVQWKEQMAKQLGYLDGDGNVDSSQLKMEDLVDFDGANGNMPPLSTFGCKGFQICAHQTVSGGSVIYLFMVFSDIGKLGDPYYIPAEVNANMYYRTYNSYATNSNRLTENMNYYVPGKISLPSNVEDVTQAYFTGNILTTNTDSKAVIINDSLTRSDYTAEMNTEYSAQSVYYQDAYSSLCKNLTMTYNKLTANQKNSRIFNNLIETTGLSGEKHYVSKDGEAAVVKNGDLTIDANLIGKIRSGTADYNGDKHGDANIHFVIATGDVTVEKDYEGVIIAGGTITVKNGVDVTANADKAAFAMSAAAKDDLEDTPAKFVKNASHYLVGGVGKTEESTGRMSMYDFVTYSNWTKQ